MGIYSGVAEYADLGISVFDQAHQGGIDAERLPQFLCNTLVILALPAVFGASAVWLTFGVYETLTLGIAYALYRYSERNGVVFR